MGFPKTLAELKSSGYTFKNDGYCRGCGDAIEWWTTKQGKTIPMNSMDRSDDAAVAHFTVCPEADSFRKGK